MSKTFCTSAASISATRRCAFPERLDRETLDRMRREMGSAVFNCQYQQNPIAPDGSPLRWEWFGTSDNNLDAVLGGFVVWFAWIEAEPVGLFLMEFISAGMAEDSGLRAHLLDSAPFMRSIAMGFILLPVLRFAPRGLIPERRGDVT